MFLIFKLFLNYFSKIHVYRYFILDINSVLFLRCMIHIWDIQDIDTHLIVHIIKTRLSFKDPISWITFYILFYI